ncbi:MAG: hypothetical protein NTY86_21580 [Deltaproteobacteria bacterium]|nr:hypothetical protein [Deltaproteobacteria bacterium]
MNLAQIPLFFNRTDQIDKGFFPFPSYDDVRRTQFHHFLGLRGSMNASQDDFHPRVFFFIEGDEFEAKRQMDGPAGYTENIGISLFDRLQGLFEEVRCIGYFIIQINDVDVFKFCPDQSGCQIANTHRIEFTGGIKLPWGIYESDFHSTVSLLVLTRKVNGRINRLIGIFGGKGSFRNTCKHLLWK